MSTIDNFKLPNDKFSIEEAEKGYVLSFSEGVTNIPDYFAVNIAKENNVRISNISEINFPSTLISIGDEAFEGIRYVDSILLPQSIERIGDRAFSNIDTDKTFVQLPEKPLDLGKHNFMSNNNCVHYVGKHFMGIDNIMIPHPFSGTLEIKEGTLSIAGGALRCIDEGYCDKVIIPSSVEKIGEGAFFKPEFSHIQIEVAPDNKYFSSNGGSLYNADKTVLIEAFCDNDEFGYKVADNIQHITPNAFSCYKPTVLSLGKNLKTINLDELNLSPDTVINTQGYSIPIIAESSETQKFTIQEGMPKEIPYISSYFYEISRSESERIVCNDTMGDFCVAVKLPEQITFFEDISGERIVVNAGDYLIQSESDPNEIWFARQETFDNQFTNKQEFEDQDEISFYFDYFVKETNEYVYRNGNLEFKNGVTHIGKNWDKYISEDWMLCETTSKIYLPPSIQTIDDGAFSGFYELKEVTGGEGLIKIGNEAFKDCNSLTSFPFESDLASIGQSAFVNCSALTDAPSSSNIVFIGENAFQNTAFYNDKNNWEQGDVTSLYMGTNLIETQVQKTPSVFTIKEGTTLIAENAIDNDLCESATIVPESVTSICGYAPTNFHYAGTQENWDKIHKPDTETQISENVFALSSGPKEWLYDYQLNNDGISYSIVSCNDTSSEKISIPEKHQGLLVTGIKEYAFENLGNIETIELPNSITSIDACAFYGCNYLETIRIGTGIEKINANVFDGCDNVTKIYFASPDTIITGDIDGYLPNADFINDYDTDKSTDKEIDAPTAEQPNNYEDYEWE